MSKYTTDVLAYFTPIGWLISFFAGTRKESALHLNNALWVYILAIACNIIKGILVYFSLGFIGTLLTAIPLVLWVFGLLSVVQGTNKPLPFVGHIQIIH